VARGWRRLHNEELHNLYTATNFIRVIKPGMIDWAGHVARTGKMINAYKILGGKSKGTKPLFRYRHRREDNIKMDLGEIICESVGCIQLFLDRVQWRGFDNTVISVRVSKSRVFFIRFLGRNNSCLTRSQSVLSSCSNSLLIYINDACGTTMSPSG
jgi:hypothetical protein